MQDQGVQALISDGILSIEDIALIATQAASDGLQDQGVQTLINDKHLTVAAVCGLTDLQAMFRKIKVQTLISDGILSIKDIASIATQVASYALQDQGVQTLIRASAQPDTLGIERLRRFIPMARRHSESMPDAWVEKSHRGMGAAAINGAVVASALRDKVSTVDALRPIAGYLEDGDCARLSAARLSQVQSSMSI